MATFFKYDAGNGIQNVMELAKDTFGVMAVQEIH